MPAAVSVRLSSPPGTMRLSNTAPAFTPVEFTGEDSRWNTTAARETVPDRSYSTGVTSAVLPNRPDEPVIRLLILTPDEIVLDTDVTSLRFQQKDGWRGILPNHTPFITSLVNGTLLYRLPGDPSPYYVALYGGTLEVKGGGVNRNGQVQTVFSTVVVLTAAAEPGDDVQELALHLLERQAEADALAFEAHIEFTKVRTALVRALTDLPEPLDVIR